MEGRKRTDDGEMSGVIVRDGRGLMALLVCFGLLRSAHADDIDDYVTAQMRKQHIPGLSLAVVQGGKVVKSEGYGLASLELGAPISPASVYRIGALSTQFTAMLTLMMTESGSVKLDDPISKYVSHTPPAWTAITVRNLLNQTSGIPDYKTTPQWRAAVHPIADTDLIQYVFASPVAFAAGAKSAYSNTNELLLQTILEKVSGKLYGALLRERITTPLGMGSTKVYNPAEIVPNRVSGYTHAAIGGAVRNAVPSLESAAHTLLSTADDLAKWDAALSAESLVKKATLDQIATAPKLANGSAGGFGFGGRITTIRGHLLREDRTGSADRTEITGFAPVISRFVDDHMTVVVLTNADDANVGSIARGVTSFYVSGLSTASVKPIPDTQPQTTALLRDIFTKFAAGTGDPGVFIPEMWKLIQPSIENPAEYRAFGPLASIDLLNYENVEAVSIQTYQYRMNYEKATLVVDLVLDKAGKVSSLHIRPE